MKMKSFFPMNTRNFVLVLLLAGMMIACNDVLDVVPKEQISNEQVWAETANADLFLNDVYLAVPTLFPWDPIENFSDNSITGQNGNTSLVLYAQSNYTPSNAPNQWNRYSAIRKCNVFIENVSASSLDEDWKKLRLAEARFLRAYFYSLLWTYHGGVPIVTEVLNQNEQGDEIFRARNTSQETFEFMANELSAIETDLPDLPEAPGRVTKGAALALKGWVELFNAGPLKNPGNDSDRWQLAADTYEKIIDSEVYDLFPDYGTLFFEENANNVEVIFAFQHLGGTFLGNTKDGVIGPRFINGSLTAFAHITPTQDIVDEYAMANGLPITDPLSGYDPQRPYENREKRFYESVVYDGTIWKGAEMIMKLGVESANSIDISNSGNSTRTGYYLKKAIDPRYAVAFNNQNDADWIIFRFAEVLLGYAEAQNEATGPDALVYEAINRIRERSELPNLPTGLSQDEMREAIYRERRVELAFEEKRFYDLLRLKLAEEKLNGPLHAMVIRQTNGEWVYSVEPAAGGMRSFDPNKNYLLPIPQYAMDLNSELEQNPNYGE